MDLNKQKMKMMIESGFEFPAKEKRHHKIKFTTRLRTIG